MLMADEVEGLVGVSLGERLGEWVVEPMLSLDIGSQVTMRDGEDSVLHSVAEEHCCSVSDQGLALLEAEGGNRMDACPMTGNGDTNCETMADFECRDADVNPEIRNVSSIELGLSRICFDEMQRKSDVKLTSGNQMDCSDDGRVFSNVQQVDSVPGCLTAQKEPDYTVAGDNPSLESLLGDVSSGTVTGAVDDRSSKSLVVPDDFRLDGVLAALNFTDVVESSDLVVKEGKCNTRTDDGILDFKCPDAPSSSLRRSSRTRKSFQKAEGQKHATKGMKKASNLSLCGTIDMLSKATRKKRSCLSRSLCSSSWGLSGKLSKYFESSNEFSLNKVLDKEPKKGKASQRSRKKNVLNVVASSQSSEGKQGVSCRPIRLKVTFGKKEEQVKVQAIPPVGIDALSGLQPGCDDKQLDLRSNIETKGGNVMDDSVQKEIPIMKRCSNSLENIQFTGTDSEICSTFEKSNNADSVPLEPEKLATSSGDKYLDPGTSPDSEVIDQVIDSTIGPRTLTVIHDPVNMASNGTADLGNVNCSLPSKSVKKKKNKKDKLCQAGNSGMEDKLLCQSSTDKAKVSKKGQKVNNGFCSTDAGITALSENPSSNTSGSELITSEFLSVSDEGTHKAPGLDNGAESHICSGMGVGIEVADSGNSCQLLPPDEKTRGKRNSKGSKVKGKSTNKAKIIDATGNWKEPSDQVKFNNKKLTSKSKAKENGILDATRNEGHQLETGKYVMLNVEKTDTSNGLTPGSLTCEVGLPTEVGEPILPPRVAWVCCDDCDKWRCIPAELADAIEESSCRWTCKDNQDQAFADCSIPQEKSNADINAELQISDEEDARVGNLGSKASGIRHAVASQPATWMRIKSNLFLQRSRKTQTVDEIMVCHCKPPADGSMGCGSQCLNRMLNIECVKGTCPCGDLCSNQQFQKRQYAELNCFRCGKKGYGLQAAEDIAKGRFLIEYVGEVLDLQAYETRQREYASKGHKHFYFMTLNGNEVIDACFKGNLGRFVNHSCDPNCRTEKWVVNGEICVGLFALRKIRKGEELTFDYNYVRVFGAAAKKCHCGTAKCRGYIGGDPLNAEVIVQADSDEEFPEPVVLNEKGQIDHTLENLMAKTKSQDLELLPTADNSCEENLEVILEDGHIANRLEKFPLDVDGRSPTLTEKKAIDEVYESSDNLTVLQREVASNEAVSAVEQLSSTTGQISSPIADVLPVKKMVKKSLSGSIDSSGRMSEVDMVECERAPSKPRPRTKISRPSKSVKNRKSNSNSGDNEKALVIAHRSQVLPYKLKKLPEGSAHCHLEAVEEKLNKLLDADGGICKRKDASKGYLKLLLLTAASGDSCNGGAIQSNRELSMILDAILKTKSRGVLLDIINKNGLQMLHNMLKLCRKDFNKIPILRKLLKVLEFLAEKQILTIERINGDPLHPGVESFRESILTFTEHTDKKVHQIARHFRDRWIRWPIRKREFNRSSNPNRFFGNQRWREHGVRPREPVDSNQQLVTTDTRMQESSSPQISDSQPVLSRPRKRKSRWDQPADPVSFRQRKEQRLQPSSPQKIMTSPKAEIGGGGGSHTVGAREEENCCGSAQNFSGISGKEDEIMRNSDDDAPPPGFSSPQNSEDTPPGFSLQKSEPPPGFSSSQKSEPPPGFSSLSPQNSSLVKGDSVVSIGHLQERFNPHLRVAYGVPSSIMQQFGTLQSGMVADSWAIAPAMPFQPFPPLPPYPRDKRDCPQPCASKGVITGGGPEEMRLDNNCLHGDSFRGQGIPSTSGGASASNVQNAGTTNQQHMLHQERGFSNSPGRRFHHHRQRKWNPVDHRAPWLRKRYGWGFKGNHPRNGVYNASMETIGNERNGQRLADVNHSVEYAGNSC